MSGRKYQVGLFNQEVVDSMAQGLRHRQLNDSWSENQYFTIEAKDEAEARRKITRRYPEENGYVISSVELAHDDDYD